MLLTLNKLHKREILIYEFIDNELKTIESKNDKSYIIKKINVYISELINELLIDIENKIDNLFSIYDTKRGEEYIKILSNEEYILTYSLNMKSRLYKYVLADDTNSDIFVNNGEIVNIFDKFYTSEHIVKYCLEQLTIFYKFTEFDLVIEPSAGSGNFLLNIEHKNKIGLDIKPEHKSIIKQDFFTYTPEENKFLNILTIGNPPFGKVCSLAIKFFNHASKFSNIIAFVIPRSFRKTSIQNKLSDNFDLIHDVDIPIKPDTFDPPINIKCCFQIWIRNSIKREILKLDLTHEDWTFLNYKSDDVCTSDFAIRAYGSNCGQICETEFDILNPKGWHFIKSKIDIDILKNKFRSLNFVKSENTARQNSLGKAELIELYKKTN